MAIERQRIIDRQVISEYPGSIEAIANIADPTERKMAILMRKVQARLMRTQLAAIHGSSGMDILETDVRNTRARIADRALGNGHNLIGAYDVPVHLNWDKIDQAAQLPAVLNGVIPAPYVTV